MARRLKANEGPCRDCSGSKGHYVGNHGGERWVDCDTCVAPYALESGLAKLRAKTGEFRPKLTRFEAAALLARLEAADKMAAAIEQEVYYAYAPATCAALEAYRNLAHAVEGGG